MRLECFIGEDADVSIEQQDGSIYVYRLVITTQGGQVDLYIDERYASAFVDELSRFVQEVKDGQ